MTRLPCPHCGAKDARTASKWGGDSFVYCGTCKAEGAPADTHVGAVAAWNRRTSPPCPPDLTTQADAEIAMLRGGFTRRLLARGLICRNSALWREHVPTDAGKHVAHLLRGNPPPPSVVMRAAWRVWLALGRRGNTASAYDAWSAGAKAEDAARHTAEIGRVLAESITPLPAAVGLWRALMGAR